MSIVFWITWGLTRWHSGKESACQWRRCNRCEFRRHRRCRFNPLMKAMATHCSILAWKVPWREEPGGLQSMLSQRVRHDWTCMHAFKKKKKNLNHRREIAITELCESFKMNHWIRVYLSYQHTLLPFDYLIHELFIGWGLLICSLSEILTDFLSPNFCYFHLPSGL